MNLGADIAATTNGDGKTAVSYFGLWDDNRLSQSIDFIKCIYENYMSLNEAIITLIEMDLDSYHYKESENYIKAKILLGRTFAELMGIFCLTIEMIKI